MSSPLLEDINLAGAHGILVNVTPFEPEWEGFVTVSIANTTPNPVRVYANEGLCQVLFFQSDEPCANDHHPLDPLQLSR